MKSFNKIQACLLLIRNFLTSRASVFGVSETRCSICLEPFIPVSIFKNPLFPSSLLCPACQQDFPPLNIRRCGKCGLPFQDSNNYSDNSICPQCSANTPPWKELSCYGIYSGKLRDSILALKYSSHLYLTRFFADLLLESSICLSKPDIIIPVPLSETRLKSRGFNQSLEITKHLSRMSGFNFSGNLLKRIKNNKPQEGLNAEERRKNIQGVFEASGKVKDKTVWLVDDVMTTGSTLAECSRVLLDKGAKSVSLLFVARTL